VRQIENFIKSALRPLNLFPESVKWATKTSAGFKEYLALISSESKTTDSPRDQTLTFKKFGICVWWGDGNVISEIQLKGLRICW
jgi:hypothetical protein